MTTLVVGANGKTGRLAVLQLLERGLQVRAVVRSADRLPHSIRNHENISVACTSVLDLSDAELRRLVDGCGAVVCCLGHNMTWRGIYGRPRRLVTESVRRICKALQNSKPKHPVRFVLMNTTGNRNRNLNEKISLGEKCVIGLLRLLLPPHVDNEKASDVLRLEYAQGHPAVEWAAVRPDTLKDADEVTAYETYPSPVRSALFNAGETSRINVAHFMAELVSTDLWDQWKGQMPVIYNQVFDADKRPR